MTLSRTLTVAAATLCIAGTTAANDVKFGGFISHGYIQSSANQYLVDSEDGDFNYAEVGVNATWSPAERTLIRGQLFAFELGEYGNFDPLIDYLFVDYSFAQSLGVRLGRVKRIEGIYTDIQDIDVARTTILLPMGQYDPRYRDFTAAVDGISIYGNTAAGDHQFDYTVYYGKIDFDTESGVAGYGQTIAGRTLINAEVTELVSDTNSGAQLWWYTPLSGLRVGISHTLYENVALRTEGTHPVFGVPVVLNDLADVSQSRLSFEYFTGDWTFTSEYAALTREYTRNTSVAGNPMPPEDREETGFSWYVSASKRFLEKFEGGVTYTYYLGDEEVNSAPRDYQEDLQFSLRYDAAANWTIKAEMHFFNGTNRLFNQFGQNPGPSDTDWNLVALKNSFAF